MLNHDTRTAILRLKDGGHSLKNIARTLGVSRNSVRQVLKSGSNEVPQIVRPERCQENHDMIIELFGTCRGNLVRIHEELQAKGVVIAYQTLTGYCRRHGIGVKPPKPTGRYTFLPAEEMQHDTSPHTVEIGGKKCKVQCASVVLCYSRMIYAQVYPGFDRFYCKVFLTEAIKYFGGAAGRCMIDNSNVVIAHGTGKNAVPAAEMKVFEDRFGFKFEAHEIGDANRSARVEAPFCYIENNFYPGRTFSDFADLNRQFIVWCKCDHQRFRRSFQASPVDLFQTERLHLKPLPIHIPEVYKLEQRTGSLEGYVNIETNRYSLPLDLIGQKVEVHIGLSTIRIFHKHRLVAEHARLEKGRHYRVTLEKHKSNQHWKRRQASVVESPQALTLKAAGSEFAELIKRLKSTTRSSNRQIQRLYRMYLEYPTAPLCTAIGQALTYGLTDLERIESMTLQTIAGDYFCLSPMQEE